MNLSSQFPVIFKKHTFKRIGKNLKISRKRLSKTDFKSIHISLDSLRTWHNHQFSKTSVYFGKKAWSFIL